jgi:ABC-type multidrug transport system fused ATPase/permease subunit
MRNLSKLKIIVFIFCASVIFIRYYKISIHEEGYGKSWYYGDSFSCKNVESSAMFYIDSGFTYFHMLPVYFYKDPTASETRVYTHYPPLAEWIGGITSIITGSTNEKVLSLLAVFLSLCLFFLIYKILAQLTNKPIESFVAATCLVLSNYFLAWASDFHQHVYIEICRWLFVWLWWQYLTTKKSNWIVLILAFLYACICWVSFEAYVYIAIITVGFSFVITKKIIRREVFVLLMVPVCMFALRLYLNYLHLHTWEAVIKDFSAAYDTRTGATTGYSELGRAMTWKDYIYLLPKTRFERLGHFYLFPSIVLIGLCILGLIEIKKHNNQLFKLGLVIYIACISWTLLMSQHALIHIFTLRHLAIFIGLTLGFGLVKYMAIMRQDFTQKNRLKCIFHSVVVLYSVVYFSVNTFYFLYIKYGFAYPYLGTDTYESAIKFLK